MRRKTFKVGDRVESGAVGTEEHDTGTVVSFTFSQMKVYWDKAGEVYNEDPADVRLVNP